jgi:hypothetical protein
MPFTTGAPTIDTVTPAEVDDEGGAEIVIKGTFRDEEASVVVIVSGTEFPCYAAKRGESYLPRPRNPNTIIVAVPPLARGGPYNVKVTQTIHNVTKAAAVTVRCRSLYTRTFELRRMLPPHWRTGPRSSDMLDLLTP